MSDFDELVLSTETIRELTGGELGKVAGGVQAADSRRLCGQHPVAHPDVRLHGLLPVDQRALHGRPLAVVTIGRGGSPR